MAATLTDPRPPDRAGRKPTRAFAWGDNPHGALGMGGSGRATTPARVLLPDDLVTTAAGAGFSLGVTRSGQLWSWGTNDFGQLGDGTTTHRLTPVAVKIPAGTRVRSVVAGRYHVLALSVDGSVLAWGRNQVGQLGDGTTAERHEPVRVQLAGRPSELAAGSAHSLAIVRGELLAWGGLSSSEAVGPAAGSTVPTALQLGKRVTAATVRTGGSATAIIDTHRTVHIWGRRFGTPQQPTTLPRKAFGLGVGDGHVIVLNSDGSVTSIGVNGSGQLGDGTTTLRTEPVTWRLPGGGRPTDIGVAGDHTVVVTRDARVYTWGANTTGYLGDGTGKSAPSPVELASLKGAQIKTVAVGNFHTIVTVGTTSPRSLKISVNRTRARTPMRITIQELDAFGTPLRRVNGASIAVNGNDIRGDSFTPPTAGSYLITAVKDDLRGQTRVQVSP